jgi:hypothetical protein
MTFSFCASVSLQYTGARQIRRGIAGLGSGSADPTCNHLSFQLQKFYEQRFFFLTSFLTTPPLSSIAWRQ